MPYVLLTLGAILFVAGVRGKNAELWTLVKGDFTGSNNFVFWVAAVAAVGAVGYVKPLKPLSIAFLTLLLVVLILSNKGVIAKLETYLNTPSSTSPVSPTAAPEGLPPLPPLSPAEQINGNLGGMLKGLGR